MFLTSPLIEQAIALKTFQTLTSCPCLHRRPDGLCRSSILRHGRPSSWANEESSRITVAECFVCPIWKLQNGGAQ
jgi:hypothetical protein